MTAAPRARRLATALVVLTALALGPHAPGGAAPKPPTGTIDEYPTMASFSAPPSIAAGPDGNVWFTERSTNKVGRVTPAGVVTEFDVPTPASSPEGIVAGPDGNLWFTEHTGQKIGRMSPQGVTVAEYPIPASGSPVGTCFDLGGSPPCPRGITMGPDGNIWFTEFNGNKISRLRTSDGKIDQFPIPTYRAGPTFAGEPVEAIRGPPADDAITFAKQMLQLLEEASFSTTCKHAPLLALMDACLELADGAGRAPDHPEVAALAERVIALYWPQLVPSRRPDRRSRSASPGGQAEIVSLVRRARAGGHGTARTLAEVRSAPASHSRVLSSTQEVPVPDAFGGLEETCSDGGVSVGLRATSGG